MNRYKKEANRRFPDPDASISSTEGDEPKVKGGNLPLMIGEEEHRIRSEVMRRNIVQQLKHKHIPDFKRKIVDQILEERKKLPGYSPGGVKTHQKSATVNDDS